MKKIIGIMMVLGLVAVTMLFIISTPEDYHEMQDYPWELRSVESELEQFKGISFKIKKRTLSTSGVEYELTNSTEFDAVYGTDEYVLHVQIEGAWYEVKVDVDEGLMASVLSSKTSYTSSKNWEQRYGELAPGCYRIVIPITVDGAEYYMTDEFVIRN